MTYSDDFLSLNQHYCRPSVLGCRPKHHIILFAEWDSAALAIDLGSAGDQESAIVRQRRLHHPFSAVDVSFYRVHQVFDDEVDADRRRKVYDHIRSLSKLVEVDAVGAHQRMRNRLLDEEMAAHPCRGQGNRAYAGYSD